LYLYLLSRKILMFQYISRHIFHAISHQWKTDNRQISTRFSTAFFSPGFSLRGLKSDRLSLLRGIRRSLRQGRVVTFFSLVGNNRLSLHDENSYSVRNKRKTERVNGDKSTSALFRGGTHNGDFSLKHSSRPLPTASG